MFIFFYRITPIPCELSAEQNSGISRPARAATYVRHLLIPPSPMSLHLDLETTRTSATTGTLELAALGDNMRLLQRLLVSVPVNGRKLSLTLCL